jgi:hypothetical protein
VAYNEALAERIRAHLGAADGLNERKMFGGIAFMLNGNVLVGVMNDDLIVRVDAAESEDALSQPGARPFDYTGRPMKGWLFVGPSGCGSDADLGGWIERAMGFVTTLPPK